MANIFQTYGIKEVANVYFEALEDGRAGTYSEGIKKGDIVLYLDTLKVSTIEQTAENTTAKGGWGNPDLISWDYNKEVTVTLEDALLSMESLALMLGGAKKVASASDKITVHRTADKLQSSDTLAKPNNFSATEYKWINLSTGTRGQKGKTSGADPVVKAGERVRFFWEEEIADESKNAIEVTISANTFPGTYKVIGDTKIRSQATGEDDLFQFVISKAKVNSEVSMTMEAEGDPATFSMTLKALRDDDGNMFKLIKYSDAAINA